MQWPLWGAWTIALATRVITADLWCTMSWSKILKYIQLMNIVFIHWNLQREICIATLVWRLITIQIRMNYLLSLLFLFLSLAGWWGSWGLYSMWESSFNALWIPCFIFLQSSGAYTLLQSIYIRYDVISFWWWWLLLFWDGWGIISWCAIGILQLSDSSVLSHCTDGQPLSLDEVWSNIHPNYKQRLLQRPWDTLTQQVTVISTPTPLY